MPNTGQVAYRNINQSDVNPGAVTTRTVSLKDFDISTGIVRTPTNASFIRVENHSGHHIKVSFLDRFNQVFDLTLTPRTIKSLNFPQQMIMEVDLFDLVREIPKTIDPTSLSAAENSYIGSDAPMYPTIISSGVAVPVPFSSGYISIIASPYPIVVEDFEIPFNTRDNTVKGSDVSTAAAQALTLVAPQGVNALQYPLETGVGISLFHTLMVVNLSATALTSISIYADFESYTIGNDTITFQVQQGIYEWDLTYYAAYVLSTNAGQQLLGSFHRAGSYNVANDGIM